MAMPGVFLHVALISDQNISMVEKKLNINRCIMRDCIQKRKTDL